MHAQLRCTHIYCINTHRAGGDWADSAAAGHIAAHGDGLNWNFCLRAKVTEDGSGDAVGSVALISVELDHWAAVQSWPVLRVMLIVIVGVNCMGIIGRDQ